MSQPNDPPEIFIECKCGNVREIPHEGGFDDLLCQECGWIGRWSLVDDLDDPYCDNDW